jgi:2'-5' RNA ligase
VEQVGGLQRLRLFIAVDVPRPHLERVAEAIGPLKQRWPDARWAPLDNQHVTLKFLGSVDADRVDEIAGCVARVAAERQPVSVSLNGLGTFPSDRRMRVLWVGFDDPAGSLGEVAGRLERCLEPFGFPAESRPFTPHLTLARWRTPERLSGPLEHHDLPPEPFLVSDLVLYRSHLSPTGAIYEALQRFPLGAI